MNNYQDKYALIAQAIIDYSEANFESKKIRLFADGRSKLADIPFEDVESILEDIQREDAIEEFDITRSGTSSNTEVEIAFNKGNGFGNWCVTHSNRKNRKLSDLNQINFEKILNLIHEMDERFQIKQSHKMTVSARCSADKEKYPSMEEVINPYSEDCLKFRGDAIEYLSDEGVITHFDVHGSYDDQIVDIKIDVQKFLKLKAEVWSESGARSEKVKKPVAVTDAEATKSKVFEICYTAAREVFLNGFLLTQLTFDSENHLVFEYVFKNQNRDLTLTEIEQNLRGTQLTKTLPKIVENWGFAGDLKKVFFDVSKSKIKFRNPIDQQTLIALGIERLRFPRQNAS